MDIKAGRSGIKAGRYSRLQGPGENTDDDDRPPYM